MRLSLRAAGAVVLCAISVAGCNAFSATTAPTSTPPPFYTEVPILSTPWPHGTVGKYGLRIDPGLLKLLPAAAGGLPVIESPDLETPALDDQATAERLAALAYARIATVADPNWAAIAVMRLQPGATSDDAYRAVHDEYVAGACSHAGGVSGQSTADIGDRTVDVATCAGGIAAYTLRLDDQTVVGALDFGPRHLARQLIAAIP